MPDRRPQSVASRDRRETSVYQPSVSSVIEPATTTTTTEPATPATILHTVPSVQQLPAIVFGALLYTEVLKLDVRTDVTTTTSEPATPPPATTP